MREKKLKNDDKKLHKKLIIYYGIDFFFLSKGNLIYFARQQLQKTARKPKKVKNFFRINVTE